MSSRILTDQNKNNLAKEKDYRTNGNETEISNRELDINLIIDIILSDEKLFKYVMKLVKARLSPQSRHDRQWCQHVVDVCIEKAIEEVRVLDIVKGIMADRMFLSRPIHKDPAPASLDFIPNSPPRYSVNSDNKIGKIAAVSKAITQSPPLASSAKKDSPSLQPSPKLPDPKDIYDHTETCSESDESENNERNFDQTEEETDDMRPNFSFSEPEQVSFTSPKRMLKQLNKNKQPVVKRDSEVDVDIEPAGGSELRAAKPVAVSSNAATALSINLDELKLNHDMSFGGSDYQQSNQSPNSHDSQASTVEMLLGADIVSESISSEREEEVRTLSTFGMDKEDFDALTEFNDLPTMRESDDKYSSIDSEAILKGPRGAVGDDGDGEVVFDSVERSERFGGGPGSLDASADTSIHFSLQIPDWSAVDQPSEAKRDEKSRVGRYERNSQSSEDFKSLEDAHLVSQIDSNTANDIETDNRGDEVDQLGSYSTTRYSAKGMSQVDDDDDDEEERGLDDQVKDWEKSILSQLRKEGALSEDEEETGEAVAVAVAAAEEDDNDDDDKYGADADFESYEPSPAKLKMTSAGENRVNPPSTNNLFYFDQTQFDDAADEQVTGKPVRRVSFSQSLISDVYYREKVSAEEKREMFYSHIEEEEFSYEQGEESIRAQKLGLTWMEWVDQKLTDSPQKKGNVVDDDEFEQLEEANDDGDGDDGDDTFSYHSEEESDEDNW